MAFVAPMPDRVGRYNIVLQIARGGMATVYLARAEGLGGFDRYVAVKLTAEHLRDDPEFAQHLVDEAKLVAHLRHPNVVPVLDVGEHETGAVFLVMEYIPGDSLGGLFRAVRQQNETLPTRIGLRILVDALQGLHAAHEHRDEDGRLLNIVHRDFSPQNILVGTDGIARLTDFGIAKAASRESFTVAGTMKGKVSYASPEQAKGAPLDRRCDVWAGGVVAWEIFGGRKLFPSHDRTLLDVVSGPPPRIRTVDPSIPAELDDVVAQALSPDLDKRIPTAQQFARALTAAARPHNLIAEVDEVAEYVQRLVQPTLQQRKRAIDDARYRRSTGASSPDDTTDPFPSLPDLPTSPMEKLDPALLKASTPQPTYDDPPSSLRSGYDRTPSGMETTEPEPEIPMGGAADRARNAVEMIRRKSIEISRLAVDLYRQKPKVVIAAASGAGLFLFIIIIAIAASGPSAKERALAAASAAASASTLALQTEAPPKKASPSLGEPEPLPATLGIAANAPVARVQVGHRVVEMEVAAPNAEIELLPDEVDSTLAVTATSTDGRTANASWSPSDGAIQLSFGDSAHHGAARFGGNVKLGGSAKKR